MSMDNFRSGLTGTLTADTVQQWFWEMRLHGPELLSVIRPVCRRPVAQFAVTNGLLAERIRSEQISIQVNPTVSNWGRDRVSK